MSQAQPKQSKATDPKEMHPKPPYQEQPQEFPGREHEMENKPDHGERTYEGHGRLLGQTAPRQ